MKKIYEFNFTLLYHFTLSFYQMFLIRKSSPNLKGELLSNKHRTIIFLIYSYPACILYQVYFKNLIAVSKKKKHPIVRPGDKSKIKYEMEFLYLYLFHYTSDLLTNKLCFLYEKLPRHYQGSLSNSLC